MLQIYNSYKMFFPDEEQGEIPAIAFAEGIICGCVLVGANLPCYEILGMKDGVHYISHEGNIESILEKIKYYQKNEEKLQIISNSARDLLYESFTFKKVTGKFLDFCNAL